ncbi:MAG: hypothetical protein M3235_08390, partial [Actinomycetota bacterium]|nr:hypothetical protein [Actinomycetota bacterium]
MLLTPPVGVGASSRSSPDAVGRVVVVGSAEPSVVGDVGPADGLGLAGVGAAGPLPGDDPGACSDRGSFPGLVEPDGPVEPGAVPD